MQKIAVIFPFYNEEKRMRAELLEAMLAWPDVDMYLANDGSTDATLPMLQSLAAQYSANCFVENYTKNQGKAATIYHTVNKVISTGNYTHVAYFDADFSTPLTEVKRMFRALQKHPEKFIIGCRVLLLNADINRKLYRHIIGRFIATLVGFNFKLGIYDTQCGAKIFPVAIAQAGFKEPFLTKWLFDVEIFIRLKKAGLLTMGKEFPLNSWQDVNGSKLNWKMGFKILREVLLLNKYKTK
ncbi:glycosyltransferase [Flavobacterium subsaxonicum]|uniref:glycosyltransferase n=1 Tax=Flavobacterium subsaxonicum TaxID=426226 RepID=UPI0004219EE0|nr:glycosyltransferase [Flavobacterium subsaxonicum]